ncbi:MAG: TrmH family RNA methyltransferase [Anaerolineales bacterium]|jgi:TrmH family RNA methyltransferase
MITSTSNARIKYVRQLQTSARARQDAAAFVVEGVRLAEEAAASGWPASLVLYTHELNERGMAQLPRLQANGAAIFEVAPHVLKAASDTTTPQGILAVLARQDYPLDSKIDFALVLDNLRDPGNLGTILRTASAAGVDAVLLPPGSTDPYAPKVVRSAMGAHFRLPVLQMDWENIQAICHRQHLEVFLASAAGSQRYTAANFRQPCALLIGSEASGASQQARQLPHTSVYIPMLSQVESLNAAVAAAVLMFEVLRQRGQ